MFPTKQMNVDEAKKFNDKEKKKGDSGNPIANVLIENRLL